MTNNHQVPSETQFAPAGRAPGRVIDFFRGRLLVERLLEPMLEAIPDCVMVLNPERQVLAVNKRVLQVFGLEEREIIGRRPGEVLNCIHAMEGPDGCTTGIHCSTCGAVLAILSSQELDTCVARECRITFDNKGMSCLDLQVTATPVEIAGASLTMCVMKDISSEKRRQVLEKIFFHDVLNTASGISSLAHLLAGEKRPGDDEEEEYRSWMVELSGRLVDEIKHQRKLLAAEKGDFKPESQAVRVRQIMEEVWALYSNHTIAQYRNLVLGPLSERTIVSDGAILRRILGNFVKNALEAVAPGETVTIYSTDTERELTFHVHNPGVMPQDVQLQLFQRSFSTKGEDGRGLGTYSVKLFGERYLKGKVSFSSREPEGTTFSFTLPAAVG